MAYLQAKALSHQLEYVNCKARYPLLVAGYGSGKTHALIYRLLRFITEIPKCTIGVYLPTVELTKKIIYPRLIEIFGSSGIPYKLNKTEGTFEIWMKSGKCDIIMKSMDNPSSIIGFQTTHALIDEIDTMPTKKAEDLWIMIMARNRKKYRNKDGTVGKNTIGVTSTPEGFKFLYNYWMKKFADNPDYHIIRGKTANNHHLPPDYVKQLTASYPPQLLKAYLEGEFVNLKGNTVYSGFDRDKSNTDYTIDDFPVTQMVNIGMDFNIGRMSALVGMKSSDVGVSQLYAVSEFHNLIDTPAMIEAIRARYPDRMITIFPDASGRSRKSIDASKSDIKLLKDAGFRVNAPRKNPPVRERVLSMNTLFLNGENERNFFVNVSLCPNFTEALEKQIYDDNSVPIKDGQEDINDAAGYLVNRVFGLAKPTTAIGKMRLGI